MPVALVVEPEPTARAQLAAYVRKVRGISAITAGSVGEARAVMNVDPPDVIVTGWALPDGNGADVLRAAQAGQREPACVLFVLGEGEEEPAGIPKTATVHVLHQPVSSRRVRKLLERSTRATLDRQPLFSPAEYIQLACMGRHSAVVRCSRGTEKSGSIVVQEGEVWSAADDEGAGVEAFRRLLRADSVARLERLSDLPPRNVEGHWEHLLLDAAQREDEESTQIQLEPAELGEDDVGRQVDEHLRAGARAVLRRDLETAAEHFAAAAVLRPEDDVIQHNLDRLKSLGYPADGGGG